MKQERRFGRLFGSVFMAMVLSLVLTACGGKAPKDSSEAASKTSASIATQTEQSKEEMSAKATQGETLRLAALKGPTSMGLADLFAKADAGTEKLNYRVAGSPDEVVPLLVKKEIDVAAVPSNLAAVLYARTKGQVQVININTLGVLYLVERGDSVKSIADLKGKTIVASGKGATPEYVLRYLLQANGLSDGDVTIEWKSEHAEALAAMTKNPKAVALLPEPFVTSAEAKTPDLHRAVDLTAAWDAAQEKEKTPSALVMGVLVARKEFVAAHPEEIQHLLEAAQASVAMVKANPDKAAAIIGRLGIVPAPVAKKAIPHANLVCVTGKEMQEKLEGYLQVLFKQNPKAVGGALPQADFYYLPGSEQ